MRISEVVEEVFEWPHGTPPCGGRPRFFLWDQNHHQEGLLIQRNKAYQWNQTGSIDETAGNYQGRLDMYSVMKQTNLDSLP